MTESVSETETWKQFEIWLFSNNETFMIWASITLTKELIKTNNRWAKQRQPVR